MSWAIGIARRAGSTTGALGARALCGAALIGASLSGCAQQQPIRTAGYHGHEYFSEAKYGAASPRVVADGQPVPRGGGQYLVGHPYTIAGHTYYPRENPNYSAVGLASWYGDAFHGRRTANGEVYDMRSISAAHPTMPLPSYARVTNLANGYSLVVRVNDRGPYHGGRVMDVSSRAADVLDFKGSGTARIKVDYIGPAPMDGSDDGELLAEPANRRLPRDTEWSRFAVDFSGHGRSATAVRPAAGPSDRAVGAGCPRARTRVGPRRGHGRTQPRAVGPSPGSAGATVRSRRKSGPGLRSRLESAIAPEISDPPILKRSRALFRDARESLARRAIGSVRPPPRPRRCALSRLRSVAFEASRPGSATDAGSADAGCAASR